MLEIRAKALTSQGFVYLGVVQYSECLALIELVNANDIASNLIIRSVSNDQTQDMGDTSLGMPVM